jgi:uncharacterized membrane protein
MDTYNTVRSEVLQTEHILPPNAAYQINIGKTDRIVSVIGGLLLAAYGIRKGDVTGATLAGIGTALVLRGATGFCPVTKAMGVNSAERESVSIDISASLTILKPREDVYGYWRQLENLPQFMKHLERVEQISTNQTKWKASVPGGLGTIDWTAEITEDIEDELIAWSSLPGSDIDNAGEVRFKDAPAGRGTIVQAKISYRPPAGFLGGKVVKLFNPFFRQMVKEDVRRFKRLMETGEILTIEGQPTGEKQRGS